MEATDHDRVASAFHDSTLPIDDEHRKIMKRVLAGPAKVDYYMSAKPKVTANFSSSGRGESAPLNNSGFKEKPVRIREATPDDAGAVIALLERLYAETSFLLYEPGEMKSNVEVYARRMAEGIEKGNWTMFIADCDGSLVGTLFGSRGNAKRTYHSLTVGIGVLRANWGQGIGRSLLGAAESWAKARGVRRLELTVRTTNHRAMALYERVGFEWEGVKRHSQLVENEYVNEFLMSKLIAV
jgi:RimJ/RimL family protein N-acetyltransferase